MTYLCFKKAKTPVSLLIDLLSGSKGYSHVELLFSDLVSFSSDQNDGGTRYKYILYTPEDWTLVPLNLTPEQERTVRHFCDQEQGCPYDWRGLLAFKLPWEKQSPDKWYCSECVLAALQTVGLFNHIDAHKTSPNALWDVVSAHAGG